MTRSKRLEAAERRFAERISTTVTPDRQHIEMCGAAELYAQMARLLAVANNGRPELRLIEGGIK